MWLNRGSTTTKLRVEERQLVQLVLSETQSVDFAQVAVGKSNPDRNRWQHRGFRAVASGGHLAGRRRRFITELTTTTTMAHTQPSPTGGVAPHHGHLAAHPQVNGHMPLQAPAQKGPPLTTAQKIAALNEQVWLQIGMSARSRHPGAEKWL